jgi:hypothetical protein
MGQSYTLIETTDNCKSLLGAPTAKQIGTAVARFRSLWREAVGVEAGGLLPQSVVAMHAPARQDHEFAPADLVRADRNVLARRAADDNGRGNSRIDS